jgi:hypothetical protein
MRTHWLRGCVVLAALVFFGCSKAPEPEVVDETRLPESIEVNIGSWLDKPRAELAEMVEDKTEYLRQHLQDQRSSISKDTVEMLPDLRPPVTPPIFRSVKFSKKLGISLPPYLGEDAKDREIAWHLARFGDVEAAKKLADSNDKDFADKAEQLGYERNYPAEWTRLVAMTLFDAEMKLARGEPEGAAELVHLHKQLNKLLDNKAKAGPLGAALLPIGRRALTMGAAAFHEAPFKKDLLTADIDEALKEWTDPPAPQPALVVGADKNEIARIFRKGQRSHVFAASTSTESLRALDLLSLPIPSEDVDGLVAFLDGHDRLVEILVYYSTNTRVNYPKPVNLAHHLVDHGSVGTQIAETPGVLRQTYLAGGQAYQVSILTKFSSGSAPTSAIIRIGDAKGGLAQSSLPADPRDLGVVHLDRSFDQNRLSLDPSMKPAVSLETTRGPAVERVQQPIHDPKPASVALTKEGDTDLLASVAIRWSAEINKDAMSKLMIPLWAAYGGCRIEGMEDAKDGHLAFIWENDTTRYTLRLPFVEVNPPELVAMDRRGAEALDQRKALAAVFDKSQRSERFKEGKEQKRLDRRLVGPNNTSMNVALGMAKADALARLPKSQRIRQTDLADGVSLFFLDPPNQREPFSPRQLWVRFGPNDRVAEIRVLYVEGPGKPTKDKPALLDWLRREPHGEPETLTSKWADLWSDLSKKGTAAKYGWRDDVTIMTCERDGSGSEVTIRDCPVDQPNGVALPPLQFCTRGIPNCHLGDARADVLTNWPTTQPTTPDGGLVLGQAPTSPYDLAIVWFENEKVSRIVARHRVKGTLNYNDVPRVLQEAWSRDLDTLGVIRRQDAPLGQLLQGYGWHDDVTRVRIFGQDGEDGPRMFTEWREWPVVVKTSTAKK